MRSKTWKFATGVLLLAAGQRMGAQNPPDLSQASLEDLGNIQVYSASKHLESTHDAPASVTIVTADEIEKFGYRTLADILRGVPGFYVTYDRNYSFVGVRGFGRPGNWNSRILLLVDGHRINDNIFGQGTLGTEFPVDVDLIDRVEIVRGASSSLYGNNAFFAVLNVMTRKGQAVGGTELSFEGGSYQTFKGRASYGGHYHGAEMMLSGTFFNSRGQDLFFPEFNSPATGNGIAHNADDEVHEHMLANFSFAGFSLQAVFSTREKGDPTAYFGTVFNDPRTRNTDTRQYFDLTYRHSWSGGWQLEARTSYDQYRLTAPLAIAPPTPGGPSGLDVFSSRGNWWTGEARLSRDLWEKHGITFGAELRDNLRQDQGDFANAVNSFEQDQASTWNLGLYAQDDYTITKRLSLTAGVRHDRYPGGNVVDSVSGQAPMHAAIASFGGTTNPRLGVVYHPYSKSAIKLLYGSAYRAPGVFETVPDLGSQVEDNVGLKPETVKSSELVVEQVLGQHFRLSGSLYHNRVNGLITLGPDPASGLLVYANSENVHANGGELEFSGVFPRGIQGTASLSMVDAREAQPANTRLSNSPRLMAKLKVSMPIVGKTVFAGVEGQYMSPRTTLLGNKVGAFQIFDLTLLARSLGRHFDVSANLYNALNKKYADPGRPEDPEDSIRQDGRNFRIKITGRF